jgi:hypothetical protein
MRNKNLTIMRGVAPDPAYAPAIGWVGSIVTVVAGRVRGEVIRSIGDQPGPRTVTHKAHIAIDWHDTGVRFADIQIGDDAQTLRDLAAVAAFLANELASAQAHQTAIDAAIAHHPAGSARRNEDEERKRRVRGALAGHYRPARTQQTGHASGQ